MKYLKWFLLSIFVFSGIIYSGMQGGWIESQIFKNVEAEYIDVEDSLATPRAKIDTSWIDIDFNDKDITGVNKITADSGNIAEMWVSESFVDSINAFEVYANSLLYSIGYTLSWVWLATTYYLKFNSANDYLVYDFGYIADSIFVDSMKYTGYYDMTDAHDTLYWGVMAAENSTCSPFVVDTIEIDSAGTGSNGFSHITTINSGWRNRTKMLEIFAQDISNFIELRTIIVWGTKYNKRYGQP